MRNCFNILIVVLTIVDLLLCIFLMTDYTFARAFQLHTVIYTLMYPWFIYPLTNTLLSASIFMTVVLALERYIAVCHPLFHRDLVLTHSVGMRVTLYTISVVTASITINIPKFYETKILTREQQGEDGNVTVYTIDITELRYVSEYMQYNTYVCTLDKERGGILRLALTTLLKWQLIRVIDVSSLSHKGVKLVSSKWATQK